MSDHHGEAHEKHLFNETNSANDANRGLVHPIAIVPPTPGSAVQVADGIWWTRFTLDGTQDHVNAYLLENDDYWTMVDTGNYCPEGVAAFELLQQCEPIRKKPITQLICTHYHPDHVGLAGWLGQQNVQLTTSRTCWLLAKLWQMDDRQVPSEEQISFQKRAGMPALELEAYRRTRPSRFSSLVSPLPNAYKRVQQGDQLKIGKRNWAVHMGNGHAAEHITLWSDDGIAIVGDQILPTISPNLSVHPSEPQADLASEWIASCQLMSSLAQEHTLALPGHGFPFVGVQKRCDQLLQNINLLLERLLDHLATPSTAVNCLHAVYRRELRPNERLMLLAETMGLLNHLHFKRLVHCDEVGGTLVWSRRARSRVSGLAART